MKKLLIGFGLIAIISVAQSFSPKQDRRFTISLTEQELNIVLEGLAEIPLKRSQPVYGTIMQQAQAQLQQQSPLQKPQQINKDTTKPKKNLFMDNSNKPAFPVECTYDLVNNIKGVQTSNTTGWEKGLSKREYFAAMAMNGLCQDWNRDNDRIATVPVQIADAVLSELNKSPEPTKP